MQHIVLEVFKGRLCVCLGEGDATLPLPRCEKFPCVSPDHKSAWHGTESERWGQRSAGCRGKCARNQQSWNANVSDSAAVVLNFRI